MQAWYYFVYIPPQSAVDYTRIGSNKGKTPEHNQAKNTKHPHSLEWHNSTITIVFPSTLRNTMSTLRKTVSNCNDHGMRKPKSAHCWPEHVGWIRQHIATHLVCMCSQRHAGGRQHGRHGLEVRDVRAPQVAQKRRVYVVQCSQKRSD